MSRLGRSLMRMRRKLFHLRHFTASCDELLSRKPHPRFPPPPFKRIPANEIIFEIILMESLIINEMNFSICRVFWLKVIAVAELFIANDSVRDTFREKFICYCY